MNVVLSELEYADLEKLNAWRNDPELIGKLGTGFNYISTEIDNKWYEDYLNNRDKSVRLAVKVDGVHAGVVNLTNINLVHRSAEFSILIGDPAFRGKGVGFIASAKIIDHGLRNLGLNRIWLTVLSSNLPAIAMYQKLEFKHEGRMRKALYKQGDFHDLLIMSLLKQ